MDSVRDRVRDRVRLRGLAIADPITSQVGLHPFMEFNYHSHSKTSTADKYVMVTNSLTTIWDWGPFSFMPGPLSGVSGCSVPALHVRFKNVTGYVPYRTYGSNHRAMGSTYHARCLGCHLSSQQAPSVSDE